MEINSISFNSFHIILLLVFWTELWLRLAHLQLPLSLSRALSKWHQLRERVCVFVGHWDDEIKHNKYKKNWRNKYKTKQQEFCKQQICANDDDIWPLFG